ncbi:MAG: replication initiator protein [Arizlama microvirus]|nr:MAG: replication initiator protein [Arizlama microvirus]
MPCYHPVTAWRSKEGKDPLTNKWKLVFTKQEGNELYKLEIPCGRCIGCRLERSRQWAIRCVHEASLHEENCFITLTYSDEHLLNRCGVFDEQKNEYVSTSLNKRDYVLFMKKLRKKYGSKIRFFHCGEYGGKYGRPHHHACIFNHQFKDKTLWQNTKGVSLYISEELQKLWPYGYSTIGEVTFESAAYVARYITKKITGSQAEAHYDGIEPEYVTMSRRPGIGKDWFNKYQNDIINHDAIIMRGGLKLRPPKYYDNLYSIDHQEEMEEIKRKRKQSINKEDNSYDRLEVKEYLQKIKLTELKRKIEC